MRIDRRQFLKVLTPISMRAAKVQKATLDPTKISGRCGRLRRTPARLTGRIRDLRRRGRVVVDLGVDRVADGQQDSDHNHGFDRIHIRPP